MAGKMPIHLDLAGNNCTIFGGGRNTVRRAKEFLQFGAKVTVVSPTVCPEMQALIDSNGIRYIPRRYFRGDCSNSQICVAATDTPSVNIAIATECKAKRILVNVTNPAEYGNFEFPRTVTREDLVLSVGGDAPRSVLKSARDQLQEGIPEILEKARRNGSPEE